MESQLAYAHLMAVLCSHLPNVEAGQSRRQAMRNYATGAEEVWVSGVQGRQWQSNSHVKANIGLASQRVCSSVLVRAVVSCGVVWAPQQSLGLLGSLLLLFWLSFVLFRR